MSLIVVSDGLGRDSWAMRCLALEGLLKIDGKLIGMDEIDAFVFSDPGYEWPHTYLARKAAVELHAQAELPPFYSLEKPPESEWREWISEPRTGAELAPWHRRLADANVDERAAGGFYHRRAPILWDYQRNQNITLRANAGCTQNHKALVINRWLSDFSEEVFGIGNRRWSHDVRKGGRQPHVMAIGIAADESSRAEGAEAKIGAETYVRKVYPLLEAGITKADEAEILRRHGYDWVRKSGCFGCHFQPDGWFWVLRERHPEQWAELVAYERAALQKNPNRFLRGDRPIDQVVVKWRRNNPNAAPDEVLDKSYVRGCKAKP